MPGRFREHRTTSEHRRPRRTRLQPPSGQAGRSHGVRRYHHRVVRLLHLRNGVGTRARPPLLPRRLPCRRHAGRVRHLRRRIRRPATRRGDLRTLRRQVRSQERRHHHAAAHGYRDRRSRTTAHLRADRRLGSDHPGVAAHPAGDRDGRRVGRRRTHRHGVRATGKEGPVRSVRTTGFRRWAICWRR